MGSPAFPKFLASMNSIFPDQLVREYFCIVNDIFVSDNQITDAGLAIRQPIVRVGPSKLTQRIKSSSINRIKDVKPKYRVQRVFGEKKVRYCSRKKPLYPVLNFTFHAPTLSCLMDPVKSTARITNKIHYFVIRIRYLDQHTPSKLCSHDDST